MREISKRFNPKNGPALGSAKGKAQGQAQPGAKRFDAPVAVRYEPSLGARKWVTYQTVKGELSAVDEAKLEQLVQRACRVARPRRDHRLLPMISILPRGKTTRFFSLVFCPVRNTPSHPPAFTTVARLSRLTYASVSIYPKNVHQPWPLALKLLYGSFGGISRDKATVQA